MTQAKPQPQSPLELSLTPLKAALCNAHGHTLDVLLRVKARVDSPLPRTPLSLALVIDRSGSMQGDKLEAAKACTADLVRRLQPQDEVAVITYDDSVSVALPLCSAAQAQAALPAVLAVMDSGGSTDLHGGWLAGAQQLAPRTAAQRVCRVILLSDGQANHGETREDRICEQVRLLAGTGVTTTTVGIGQGFNESLMTAMAVAGHGSALYGDSAQDLDEPFESELGLLSQLAWRDVQLVSGSATSRWRLLNDYARNADGAWAMPSIAANAEAWACFTVPMDSAVRAQARSQQAKAFHVTVKARDAQGVEHTFTASLPTLPVLDEAQWLALPADELVARRLAELRSARLLRKARGAVTRRDWREAERLLTQVEAFAADQPWIRGTVQQMRTLLQQRDSGRMEKELAYGSFAMSRRLVEIDEGVQFSLVAEAVKPAYLRRKEMQGRKSGTP